MLDAPHNGLYYQKFLSRLSLLRETRLYLEIGVQSGANLAQICAERAIGVDPAFDLSHNVTLNKVRVELYRLSSDRFFVEYAQEVIGEKKVDLAFLDGMHLFEYLLRDFFNTESRSSSDALIIMHDCMPFDGEMIERENNFFGRTPGPYAGAWTGDVWKVVKILNKYRPDLNVRLVDCHPTGLVCVSNLNPRSTILRENYLHIVKEFMEIPNDRSAIQSFYSEAVIVSADKIVEGHDHSLFFRI